MTLYDRNIREPLFEFLEETYGKIRILEEKRTGSARADVVMITPKLLYGIEIKSDADTYARLSKQVRNYDWYVEHLSEFAGKSGVSHRVPWKQGLLSVAKLFFDCR